MNVLKTVIDCEDILIRETGILKPIVEVGLHPDIFFKMLEQLSVASGTASLVTEEKISVFGITYYPKEDESYLTKTNAEGNA